MKLYDIVFSPTGGTQKAAKQLTDALKGEVSRIDLCDGKTDFSSILLSQEDVAVISVPSYGGRVPSAAIARLTMLNGHGARAVLVCVYGNRAYEDTLLELNDTATQAGFRVVAAVAAIAEHSIARQFAAGRPDRQDLQQLSDFARQIQAKLTAEDFTEPAVPGNHPYKKASGAGIVPKPTKDCVSCGLCAAECPAQAISKKNPKETNKNTCISCMRCISVCPHSARKINPVMRFIVGLALKKVCSERKGCQLFLSS